MGFIEASSKIAVFQVVLQVITLVILANGQPVTCTELDDDYKQLTGTNDLYKIYPIYQSWENANKTCNSDEASLFYPIDKTEAIAVLEVWNQTLLFRWTFLKNDSKPEKELFENITARPIWELYNTWNPKGKQCDSCKQENVAILLSDGQLTKNFPFICKKNPKSNIKVPDKTTEVTPQANSTETQPIVNNQEDYKLIKDTQFAYKIHPTYSSWKEANNTCASEGATLFYPSNECESNKVLDSWKEILAFRWIFTGSVSTPTKEMFQDIKNRPIWELYNTWHPEESKNKSNEDGKVVLLRNEQLITNFPFVCKKTTNSNFSQVPCNKIEHKKETNNNYTFINATQSFYKIHTSFKTWNNANITCNKEGAMLFYPDNTCEANAVLDLWNKTQIFKRVFIGMSSSSDGLYKTVDGRADWEVYYNWQAGEPNDNNGEGCVVLTRNGNLNDVKCGLNMPFICKIKSQNKINDAVCDKPEVDETQVINFRKDYTYLENTHSVYKIHSRYSKWQEARDICAKEGTELFFPENDCEVNTVLKFWEKVPSINEIYVGISRLKSGDFVTVDDRSIWDVYNKFRPGEPNNWNNNEDCLILMRHDRSFNDDRCDVKHPFICKKKLDTPKKNALCDTVKQITAEANLTETQDITNIEEQYKLIDGTKFAYKIHPTYSTWKEANNTCASEGATLFYPFNECEADSVLESWKERLAFRWIFTGAVSTPTKEMFQDVKKRPVWELYNTWYPEESSNKSNEDGKVVLLRNEQLITKFPFVCKKILDTNITQVPCNKTDHIKETTENYIFINATQSFYKIHTSFKTWTNANITCTKEGAMLFYPDNNCEANAVSDLWNKTQTFKRIFIGMLSSNDGLFETVDGRPDWEVYNNWQAGEPNDNNGEGCVTLARNGTLNDVECGLNMPFICKKKTENKTKVAICNEPEVDKTQGMIFHKDYTYLETTHSVYKIHPKYSRWQEAKDICAKEGTELFFPENECEVRAVVKFWESTQSMNEIYVGISRAKKGAFLTVDGRSILEVYHKKFNLGHPNKSNHKESCLVFSRHSRLYNDDSCDVKHAFICRKKIDTPKKDALCDTAEQITSEENSTETQPIIDIQEDYKPIEGTQCAYKIHPTYSSWKEANNTCASEGATLFYPLNECEANKVLDSWKKILAFRWIFTGTVYTPTKEMFQDVKDRPIWELYNTWHPEESKNKSKEDGKAVLLWNEQFITNFPFVCKKTLNSNISYDLCNKTENKIQTNNNYIFINATQNLYKIHTSFKTWTNANITCTKEGATLFYPENKCEANAVLDLWNKTQVFKRIFVGMTSSRDGLFETVDGRPDWQVYYNWQAGEPNDNNGEECVTLARNGTLNDVKCGLNMPFICKKVPENKTNDAICHKPKADKSQIIDFRQDYTYLENTHSVYKIHPRYSRWQKAKDICEKEGTELFFPENECEVSAVVKFWESTQPMNEIYIGISSPKKGVFVTIDGRPLWAVYNKFLPGEPNNLNNNEGCLMLSRHDRTFNDDSCDVKHAFICKKKIDTPKKDALCDTSVPNNTEVTLFRRDYKYLDETESLYKIHTIARDWSDAKDFCITEGAILFFPENECEARAVQNLWNNTQPFSKAFVGIFSQNEGIFETIDGRLAKDVYNKWSIDESTVSYNGDCVLFDKNDGTFSKGRCDRIHPFICKKKIDAPKGNPTCVKSDNWNDHQTSADSGTDYTLLEDTNGYYKLHTTLSTWEDAKKTCTLEGASFFYPENECEKDVVINFWNKTESIPRIFIGVSSPVAAGVFETVNGRPIADVYNKWNPGEPNNADGAEGCVILSRDGTLNDEHCSKKFAFVCKKSNSTNKDAPCDKLAETSEAHQTKVFRKDYTYVEEVENFYKIHTTPGNWQYAKKKCTMEGAKLFYPENKTEIDAVLHFWNQTQPFPYIFIGITDLLAKEDFETTDGRRISDVYDNWGTGEPNDANGKEDCVVLRRDGTLNDDQCDRKYPFVCKKSLATLEWNDRCNMADKSYIYDEVQRKCYKFHLTPKNWTDAYTVCSAEQSYLAVINSREEADLLVKMTEQAPKNKAHGQYLAGVVHLGFHNLNGKGWRSLKDQSLSFTGYDKWASQQPDGGDNELCGSMFYSGELNDLGCSQKSFFICEHDIDN